MNLTYFVYGFFVWSGFVSLDTKGEDNWGVGGGRGVVEWGGHKGWGKEAALWKKINREEFRIKLQSLWASLSSLSLGVRV